MSNLVLSSFGLFEIPFSKEIADGDLWLPSSKKALVDDLCEAVNDHASILLVGEPGVGKSCVLRALRHAMRNEDPFVRFATAGLAILFGTQSAINMAVNLHLVPAKGMTLPFISYGGSSMISLAYGMGMLLALTRERPRAALLSETLVAQGQPA